MGVQYYLQSSKSDADLGGPPDLGAAQGDLRGVIEQPLVAWLVLVRCHGVRHVMPEDNNRHSYSVEHTFE